MNKMKPVTDTRSICVQTDLPAETAEKTNQSCQTELVKDETIKRKKLNDYDKTNSPHKTAVNSEFQAPKSVDNISKTNSKSDKQYFTIKSHGKENVVLKFNESFLDDIEGASKASNLMLQRSRRRPNLITKVMTSTPTTNPQSLTPLNSIKLSAIKNTPEK